MKKYFVAIFIGLAILGSGIGSSANAAQTGPSRIKQVYVYGNGEIGIYLHDNSLYYVKYDYVNSNGMKNILAAVMYAWNANMQLRIDYNVVGTNRMLTGLYLTNE